MRSKTAQRMLDKMKKDPWWVKLKRWLIVEFYVINCLGVVKYIKNKIQSGGGMVNATQITAERWGLIRIVILQKH